MFDFIKGRVLHSTYFILYLRICSLFCIFILLFSQSGSCQLTYFGVNDGKDSTYYLSKLAETDRMLYEESDPNKHALFLLMKANLLFYLKRDSVEHYIFEAINEDPDFICNWYHTIINDTIFAKKQKYFFHEISNKIRSEISNLCTEKHKIFYEKKDNLNKKFKEILERDQIERRKNNINWSIQDSLDELNRRVLDELYTSSFFKDFSNEELHVAWLVLQHSLDCSWNYLWTERFLNNIYNNNQSKDFFSKTMRRFYEPVTGYCTRTDKENRDKFISKIRSQYGLEFSKRLGFHDY